MKTAHFLAAPKHDDKADLRHPDTSRILSLRVVADYPINNIQYFSSDTTRLYIHKNVITGLLVSVSQNHSSGPQC